VVSRDTAALCFGWAVKDKNEPNILVLSNKLYKCTKERDRDRYFVSSPPSIRHFMLDKQFRACVGQPETLENEIITENR
jgi:hypothetical protein